VNAHDVSELLGGWDSFYVMIGSSAAALTGLMFVVITLVNDSKRPATEDGISTFSTPTVVHFCLALFTAAFMSAPFRSLAPIAILAALTGMGGLIHVFRVARKTSALETYKPDAEDWSWYVLLPVIAYATLAVGALFMSAAPSLAIYAPAAAVTLLIFVGIHNAWDVVTYLALGQRDASPEPSDTGNDR
jgi:hypothetical protein